MGTIRRSKPVSAQASFVATTLTTAGPSFMAVSAISPNIGGFTTTDAGQRLRVPVAGVYLCRLQVGVSTTTGRLEVIIRKNSTAVGVGYNPTQSTILMTATCSTIVECAANDFFEFLATPGNGTATNPTIDTTAIVSNAQIMRVGST